MIQDNTLHILNGQAMENHFKKEELLENKTMIAFNEAMCWGETAEEIFSDTFISIRSKLHQTTIKEYKALTLHPLQILFEQSYERIVLWFDFDMFCQINLLTILAWLDQINYSKPIELYYVDDLFKPVEKYRLEVSGYKAIYDKLLLHQSLPDAITPIPLRQGAKLYLHYLDPNGEIFSYIRKHQDKSETDLLVLLLEEFTSYGLGDIQYLKLIRQIRNNK